MSVEGGEGREQDQQPKQIDVPKGERAVPRELDLSTARAILQAIVDTHEDTITEETPLDQVAGYSVEQVREAEEVVARSILDKHGRMAPLLSKTKEGAKPSGWISAHKSTPQGDLTLDFHEKLNVPWTEDIALRLADRISHKRLINNNYALEEPPSNERSRFGFIDNRPGGKRATLADLDKGVTVEKIRFMHRGLRWV